MIYIIIAKIAGSKLGIIPSKESIEQGRLKRIGHTTSEETRKKISAANKGNTNAKGHKMSDHNKRQLSIANSHPKSEETKRKISIANKGKVRTEEMKERIGLGHKGHVVTDEVKARISATEKETKRRLKEKLNPIGENYDSKN